ncbi:MAG TPA: head-tail connector protein [Beijerinckiaceae bacterium]
MSVVSIDELREHLNLPEGQDEALLTRKLASAEAMVADYIGQPLADLDPMPAPVIEAVLQVAGHLFENRELVTVGVSAAPLPFSALEATLPYRKWQF